MRSSSRTYLRDMLGTALVVIAICAAINVMMDPLSLFAAPRIAGLNARKPYLEHHNQLTRWTLAKRACANAGIFGNSRAEIGFDPDNEVFRQLGLHAFNHALPGSSIEVPVQQLTWLKQIGCMPKVIVLGVEFFDFLGDGTAAKPKPVPAAPRVDGKTLAEAVFSLTALRDSITTFNTQRASHPATLTDDGFNPLLNYVQEVQVSGHFGLFRQKAVENLDRWSRKPARIGPVDGRRSSQFGELDAFLALARESGSTVHLMVYPYHVEIRLMMERLGITPLFAAWKKTLVDTVEEQQNAGLQIDLTDFSKVSEQTSERIPAAGDRSTALVNFWEAGHFKRELGDTMLRQVLLDQPGYGIRLTRASLEASRKDDARQLGEAVIRDPALGRELDFLFAGRKPPAGQTPSTH